MQVCLHKIGARLLGKLTECIDNAGPLHAGTNIQAWNYKIVKVLLETHNTKRVKGRKVQKSNWDQSNTLQ